MNLLYNVTPGKNKKSNHAVMLCFISVSMDDRKEDQLVSMSLNPNERHHYEALFGSNVVSCQNLKLGGCIGQGRKTRMELKECSKHAPYMRYYIFITVKCLLRCESDIGVAKFYTVNDFMAACFILGRAMWG